jgi:hypothetical protein
MKRPSQTPAPERTLNVRRVQEVELAREHWVNGNRYGPGTVLCLPAPCAANLIEVGAARAIPDPSNDPAQSGT